ncbi:MAG: prepilin-type N-terminal cleavage/methylation domain-containing protein [Deltaproteobacteria bacterium]|nr:prepilin-type N-terminal cleavage/methylation domain-containing protein [Deltaproteobacteria bacterium]
MTPGPTVRRGNGAQAGLTLLELLVALAIFAIVGPAIYSTFTTTLVGRDRALQRAQAYSMARGVLDRIESDLRGNLDAGVKGSLLPRFLAPGAGSDFGAGRRSMIGDDGLLLDLTTLSARGVTAPEGYVVTDELAAKSVDRGDQARVVWRLEDPDPDSAPGSEPGPASGSTLVRYEIKPPRNETLDLTGVPRQVVAERVAVRLEFYAQGQWTEVWDSLAPGSQRDAAPALVRTTVELDTGDDDPIVLVSSTLIALAADKRSGLGPGSQFPGRDRPGKKRDAKNN